MDDVDGRDESGELDALWTQLGRCDRASRAELLDQLGGALVQRGRRTEALEVIEAARVLFANDGAVVDVARSDHNAGMLLAELGRRDDAIERYRRARDGYRATLHYGEAAVALRAEADLLAAGGDGDDALAALEEAAALHDDAGESVRAALARLEMAELLLELDRVDEACVLLTQSRTVLRTDGALLWVARADQLLADVASRHGAWNVAFGLVESARAVYDAADMEADRDRCDDLWCSVLVESGRAGEAVELLERSRESRRTQGDPLGVAWCDLYLGRAHARLGDAERADIHRRRARAVFDAAGLDSVLRRHELQLQ
jgi:tetratricopeptide (TPR) repeat protein